MSKEFFGIASLIAVYVASGMVLLNGLGFIKGDSTGSLFLMGAGILASVWALEERVKEMEKELKRQ